MLRHLDHRLAQAGAGHVGLGSDFDGCVLPGRIGDVTGVPLPFEAMAAHGYDAALMAKIARENWLTCLERCRK
jgi:membrane dipeptidase